MPRKAKPRWHKRLNRWFANIGEPGADGRAREVYAPDGLGRKDEDKAWKWFDAEVAARRPATVDPADLSAEGICELYLQWAEGRRDAGRLDPAHYLNKERHLVLFTGALGNRPARGLTPGDMEAFIETMRGLYSPNYVAGICSTVSAAFNWAARSKLMPVNPVAGYESPTVPRGKERFAERDEAAAWLRHLWRRTDKEAAAWPFARGLALLQRMLIRTGARPGEMCDLLWSDLKWAGWKDSNGRECARAIIPAERWKAGDVTGKPRTIYVSAPLTRALRRERDRPDRHPTNVFVHGRGRGGKGAGEPWESGSRLSKTITRIRREMIADQETIRARIEAGDEKVKAWEARWSAVEIRDEGENRLVSYRWRHTAISTLLMMGIDVPTTAELTGTSPEMIYKTYGHLLSEHLAQAAEKLGSGRRDRPRP